MSIQILPPSAPPARTVREAVRWVRETPAPHWEGDAGQKARFVGYVAGSMGAWTIVGLAGAVAFGRAIEALAGLAV